MLENFMRICLLALVLIHSSQSEQFCAEILPEEASGASGYIALKIFNGKATYSFDLDLNSFKNRTPCNLEDGLKFHVHSYWNSNTNMSAANAMCGASYTGGHYDPNFACSTSSQSYSTQCSELGRIPPSYTYSCNATTYEKGKYSMCEVGDISGKHGTVMPASAENLQFSVANFNDYLPPYVYNYLRQDSTSLMWASFVFHCAQNSNRLVCAKFSTTNFVPCSSAFESMSSSTSLSSSNGKYSAGDIAISVIIPSFVFLGFGIFFGFMCSRKNDVLLLTSPSSKI